MDTTMTRTPAATLATLAMLREAERDAAHEAIAYALLEFRAGREVRYCRGAGWPVVHCRSRAELEHAIRTGQPMRVVLQ